MNNSPPGTLSSFITAPLSGAHQKERSGRSDVSKETEMSPLSPLVGSTGD
jgi:hypothetical protein